jgi:flagellar motor switch protein FliM
MSNETLTEHELDSLIESPGDTDLEIKTSNSAVDEPQRYDLGLDSKRKPGNLLGLELLNERFGKNLQVALENFLRIEPTVNVEKLSNEKLKSILDKASSPFNAVALALDPLPGAGLLVIEPQLIYAIVDLLFGGKGRQGNPPGHVFSPTETSIAIRLIEIITQQYRLAWASIATLNLSIKQAYTQPQFVDMAEHDELLIVNRISINLGEVRGDLLVCLPYTSLESVLEQLNLTARTENGPPNSDWFFKMNRQLGAAQLELVAHLTEIETTVQGLLKLQIGQVLDCSIDPCLTVTAEGVPVLKGHYGIHQGHYALRVHRLFSSQNSASESHSN